MRAQSGKAIESFRASFSGTTSAPGDNDYDQSRAIWNGAIDRKPAVIAHCTTAQQVADAIRYARGAGLEIAVRGGGHNYAGHAVCDGGMMIHLGGMNSVEVDVAGRRAICGGGATWADVDAATQQHGLAAPGGFISHTGIAGLTLGGGIGWMTKMAGLSCDNLLAAEVVTADSRIVRASKDENADLFWALRGGGGNFGVVTSFEYALHPVGPMVNLGLFFFGLENGAEALRFGRHFVHGLPDGANGFLAIGLSAPPAPFVPEQYHFRLGHAILVVGFGSPEEHAQIVAPVRDAVKPLWELVTPLPYVALQQMFNDSVKWGSHGYEKALYLDELSDAAITVIGEHVPKKPTPLAFVPTFTMNGKYRTIPDGDTAFGGHRSAGFVFNIETADPTGADFEAGRTWVRNFYDAMKPHAAGAGTYVNFMSESDEARVQSSYGTQKFAKLRRIKSQWDPENVFHLNANIKPG